MKTRSRGTFVLSWSQTETDGQRAAPVEFLATGVLWRWSGMALRVDGPQDRLVLEAAEGAAELHQRAARMVRRLIGVDLAPTGPDTAEADLPEQSFLLTDGRATFVATLVTAPGTAELLVAFCDGVPPRDTDLWVVRSTLDRARLAPAATAGGVICFTPGTRLATPHGPRPIEALREGDLVLTRDNGPQPVLWRGQRRLSGARMHAMPGLRPIRLSTGAFGQGRPDGDLVVSPHHRMLVRGAAAQALFNSPEVLVRADALVNGTSIRRERALSEVSYVHVLLDHHNIVWANGLETESFHPGHAALEMIEPVQRAALLAVLPGLVTGAEGYGPAARRSLSAPEAAILRHEVAA
jgi:Hint domain